VLILVFFYETGLTKNEYFCSGQGAPRSEQRSNAAMDKKTKFFVSSVRNMQTLTITKPDDWHCHLRDDAALIRTVKDISTRFSRAIVMPNLIPPVINLQLAQEYHERIMQVNPDFTALMTLYLTDNTTPKIIEEAKLSGLVFAAKLYPAGATTNSDNGVTSLEKIDEVLCAMQDCEMPLLIHGEVTDSKVDIFDREQVFIERHVGRLLDKFPRLKIVLEHITTKYAVDYIMKTPSNLAATITAHHLLGDRNDLLVGGIKPHYYCLPILKRYADRQALLQAATSGNPKFFLGTDSAPHAKSKKENACGCAGIYTAHAALELYAEAFDSANVLDKLEAFASFYGADFYGLSRNVEEITLEKKPWVAPQELDFAEESLVPYRAGKQVLWKIVS